MSYEFRGKLIEKYDTVQVTDKFRKRDFVVEKTEQSNGFDFTEQVKFQLNQDRCSAIETIDIGTVVDVSFNLRGRKWEKDGKC